jgi:two-component system, response regulator PdtaR
MSLHTVSVLVVEDDGLIRMSLVEELENAGFVVLEAGNADEAITTIEANPYVDAVFTDIDMPGSMDGLKLAKFLHQTRPDLAIMLTSGYLKIP